MMFGVIKMTQNNKYGYLQTRRVVTWYNIELCLFCVQLIGRSLHSVGLLKWLEFKNIFWGLMYVKKCQEETNFISND